MCCRNEPMKAGRPRAASASRLQSARRTAFGFRRVLPILFAAMLPVLGCRPQDRKKTPGTYTGRNSIVAKTPNSRRATASQTPRRKPADPGSVVRRVRCVYEDNPWLNLDTAGDRDPEGIRFRVFLDTGNGRGVHRDGSFHVEMYQIDREATGDSARALVSEWHYATADVHRIKTPGMLGDGYYLHLCWTSKSIAGHDIEIVTRFEDEQGDAARSGTKRLRVPKYEG